MEDGVVRRRSRSWYAWSRYSKPISRLNDGTLWRRGKKMRADNYCFRRTGKRNWRIFPWSGRESVERRTKGLWHQRCLAMVLISNDIAITVIKCMIFWRSYVQLTFHCIKRPTWYNTWYNLIKNQWYVRTMNHKRIIYNSTGGWNSLILQKINLVKSFEHGE